MLIWCFTSWYSILSGGLCTWWLAGMAGIFLLAGMHPLECACRVSLSLLLSLPHCAGALVNAYFQKRTADVLVLPRRWHSPLCRLHCAYMLQT